MTRRRHVAASLLLAVALASAILGQHYFFERPEYLWDGLVFHGLAALCFVLAWRTVSTRPRHRRADTLHPGAWSTWLRRRPVQASLLGLGIFLALLAGLLARDRMGHQATGDIVVLWLLGITAVLAATFWPFTYHGRSDPRALTAALSLREREPAHRQQNPPGLWQAWLARLRAMKRDTWLEIAVVVGLTVTAFILRVTALGSVPFTLSGDEAWHGLLSRQVLRDELRNPFTMGYMSMPTFFYWPLSWSMRVMGDNIVGLRLPAALVGTVTVPLFYLFVRRLWGLRTAFLAASFLAAYDYHIHFSRLGANNVWDPVFALLFLWLLDRGLAVRQSPEQEVRRMRSLVLAGLVLGLSTYFYTGARLLPLLLVVYVTYFCLQARLKQTSMPRNLGWHLVLLVLACLVASAPMLGYALSNPDRWNARLNQVGILQSGWLDLAREMTGKGTLELLADQFLRAAGAFHAFPDRTAWYGAPRPLLGFLAGLFAVLGMAWTVVHWRERRHFLLLLWFWSVIVTGGMLTESPPSSQRLVMAIPAVALLVSIGLEQAVRLAEKLTAGRKETSGPRGIGHSQPGSPRPPRRARQPSLGRRLARLGGRDRENLLLGLLILVLVVSNVRFYFAEFTPSRRYGSVNGETATMIGHYLRDLEGPNQAYFFGAPRIYWGFGTMPFLAPQVPGTDIIEPLDAPPAFADEVRFADRSAVFLFLPERVGELTWVREALPNGRVREVADAAGSIRFVAYEVEPVGDLP